MKDAWRPADGGLELWVRLTPQSSSDRLGGIEAKGDETYLKAWVRAVPEDGKANRALVELIAAALAIAKRDIALVAGQTARIKRILIKGDYAAIAARIEKQVKDLP